MEFTRHMINELKQAYEPLRGQKIPPEPRLKMFDECDKCDPNQDALVQLYKANIPFISQLSVSRRIRKHGMTGEDINKLQKGGTNDERNQS